MKGETFFLKIVANSLEDSVVIAENVNEDFGKTLVHLWNENMYWNYKSEFHLHLAKEPKPKKKILLRGGK